MKRLTTFAFLTSLLLHCGCNSGDSSQSGAPLALSIADGTPAKNKCTVPKSKVANALTLAKASLLTEKKVAADVLWATIQIQKEKQDSKLEHFVKSQKAQIRNPTYLPEVFPSREKVSLPKSPKPGIRRFLTYLDAPCGQPEKTALSHLNSFIFKKNTTGYILTHQFIVLLLAEQAGLPISQNWRLRKKKILEEVYAEQMRASSVDCIDLYIERVAFLLFFGDQNKIERDHADLWIKTIINMQLQDGSWPLSKSSLSYEGETTNVSSPRSHTTVLAIMALQAYLTSY